MENNTLFEVLKTIDTTKVTKKAVTETDDYVSESYITHDVIPNLTFIITRDKANDI